MAAGRVGAERAGLRDGRGGWGRRKHRWGWGRQEAAGYPHPAPEREGPGGQQCGSPEPGSQARSKQQLLA